MATDDGIRLNKYLASCGLGSRRSCDALVQEGNVLVNGEPCLNPAYRVQPEDQVRAGGKLVEPRRTESIVFHKPPGFVCSRQDEEGKETIYDLLPGRFQHLAHVGRLDRDSEGLLILSNDGELSEALTHPRHKIEKVYLVTLDQGFESGILRQLERGVRIEVGHARAHSARRLSSRRLEIILTTGLKRQIRYMMQAVNHRVKRLIRTQVGPLNLGELKAGKWRVLEHAEREALIQAASAPRRR